MKLAKSVRNISLALVLSALAAGGAAAQQTLKLGHSQPAGHPYDLGFKRFADTVAKDTDGRIKIEVYPSSQLGEAVERIEGLRIGALDLTEGAFSHASQFCPELGLFGAPFLFSSQAQFAAVMDGEVGEELDRICNDRFGIRLLATFTSGNRLLFNSKRPIETAADLEGLKVRVMGGEADAMTWQVFGAIPAPMPYSEVYSALQGRRHRRRGKRTRLDPRQPLLRSRAVLCDHRSPRPADRAVDLGPRLLRPQPRGSGHPEDRRPRGRRVAA